MWKQKSGINFIKYAHEWITIQFAAAAAAGDGVFLVFSLCIDVFESKCKCYHNFRAAPGFSSPNDDEEEEEVEGRKTATKRMTTIKNYSNDNNEQQFP